jgi:putative AlgH/UPF0301 family transcriptional regulator
MCQFETKMCQFETEMFQFETEIKNNWIVIRAVLEGNVFSDEQSRRWKKL